MSLTDIIDGELTVQQGKTGKKIRIAITGELASLIERIKERKHGCRVHTLRLVFAENGRALSSLALRSRFDKARILAAKKNPKLSEQIQDFQFRDLRAKAGTDKAESGGMREAQMQLGHENMSMTEHYIRQRRGQKVTPTR